MLVACAGESIPCVTGVAMADELLNRELVLRLGVFLGIFLLMNGWENVAAKRVRSISRLRRWPGNLGVAVLDSLLARVVAPAGAVGFALLVEQRGFGLLQLVGWSPALECLVAIVVLDFAIYVQHRLFHRVPLLWRFHRMHHADVDVDVTTGARFHPGEMLLSLGFKCLVIAALGAPAASVLVFEVLLNATAMFNHSNVRVPERWERVLRWFIVTPDLHRVHHSVVRQETDSNFGFNLPWWDWLFRTYRAQPEAGHDGMTLGLDQFRHPVELRLDRMLTQPFRTLDSERRGPQ